MKTKKKVGSKPRKIKAKKIIKKTTSNLFTNAIAILAVITVGVVAWYFLPRGKKVDINYIGNASGVVDLSLSPATLELTPNQESTISINISSGSNKLSAAIIELSYDSSKVGTPIVTLGDFLPNKIVSATTTNDKISFTVGAEMASGGSEGSGTLATIKITPRIEGVSSISFTDQTIVYKAAISNNPENQVKSAIGTAISVTTPMASVTPSADPTTGTSPSPSPSLSPSPSPSAPSAARPAKPTGLRSNCYDGGNKITLRWDGVSNVDSYKVRMDQKDGNNDKSNDGLKSTEYSYDIIAGQKYSWWVHSVKSGLDSEEAKINEVICEKVVAATTTPTSTPIVVKATVKPTSTPKSTITPKPTTSTISPSSTPAQLAQQNKDAGSLNDIFINKMDILPEQALEDVVEDKNFWEKFLEWLGNLFIPTDR